MLTKILNAFPSLSAAAFRWQALLDFSEYETFASNWLVPTESFIKSFHCRNCGETHQVVKHSGNDFVSLPPPDSHCERQSLEKEDVRVLEFDVFALGSTLCKSLAIEEDRAEIGSGAVQRLGWIRNSQCQIPVYMMLKNPYLHEMTAKQLLLEEELPFVLLASSSIPTLQQQFRKFKCALFSLDNILEFTATGGPVCTSGPQLFSDFLRRVSDSTYTPAPDIQISTDYKRIIFPDGYTLNLSKAHKRRAIVRFIHEQVLLTNKDTFDIEVVREDFNARHPAKEWRSDRFKEDLFKDTGADFDRLFETIDAALGRYRLKL